MPLLAPPRIRVRFVLIVSLIVGLSTSAGAQSPADTAAAVTDSTRSETEFRAASTRYAAAVRGCYEREGLRADPALAATVDVAFTVEPTGVVREITVDTLAVSGVGIANVAKCVSQSAATWRFVPGAYAPERAILTFKLVAPSTASKP